MADEGHPIRRYKSARLKDFDYSRAGGYFVTLVTANRACLFGEIEDGEMILNRIGEMVRTEWLRSAEIRKELTLDEFVVMPNHLHGIVLLGDMADCRPALRSAQKLAKSPGDTCSPGDRADCRPALRPSKNNSPSRKRQPRSLSSFIASFKAVATKQFRQFSDDQNARLWQPGFYEHVIRDDFDLAKIREYIVNNPLKWHLDKENPANK